MWRAIGEKNPKFLSVDLRTKKTWNNRFVEEGVGYAKIHIYFINDNLPISCG